jgi:adenine C2-methylase RlmN of 23S rRNA A2503 and tRNA A37
MKIIHSVSCHQGLARELRLEEITTQLWTTDKG